jgi:hypothetical protein
VADGATESVFARQWAATLVNRLVDAEAMTEQAFRTVIEEGQREWKASVAGGDAERPWYVTAKAAEGAYATALGLSLRPDGTWRAVSVGDCCLFHWREGMLRQSWPMDAPEAFTNRPALLPSRQGAAVPAPSTVSGTWTGGDTFVLMTDAVAAWLLDRWARGEDIAGVWTGG